MKLCKKCSEVYDDTLTTNNCPKVNCGAELLSVDNIMIPAAMMLCKKYDISAIRITTIATTRRQVSFINIPASTMNMLVRNNPYPPHGWRYENDCIMTIDYFDINDTLLERLAHYKNNYKKLMTLLSDLHLWLDNLK